MHKRKTMLCQNCNKNKASVLVTKIEDSEITKMHLCEECLLLLAKPVLLDFALAGLFNADQLHADRNLCFVDPDNFKICACGVTFGDFIQSGNLGCPQCYSFFKEEINSFLIRAHGSLEHKGKAPKKLPEDIALKCKLKNLEKELFVHVNNERYEKAALVRDKIKAVKQKLEVHNAN